MRRIAQAICWVSLSAVVALSVTPAEMRPVTIFPHDFEHAAVYFIAGCAFGLVYSVNFVGCLAGLSGFTLLVEVIQHWIPGRHPRVSDFAGLVGGVALAQFTGCAWLLKSSGVTPSLSTNCTRLPEPRRALGICRALFRQ
jgi:VanZ family protein